MARRPSSVRPSVNFCANRFFSHANGRIATKLARDGLQVSVHPGCAQGQGQGQRSRDTRTFLDSWNELLRHWRSGLVAALPHAHAQSPFARALLSVNFTFARRYCDPSCLFVCLFVGWFVRWHPAGGGRQDGAAADGRSQWRYRHPHGHI